MKRTYTIFAMIFCLLTVNTVAGQTKASDTVSSNAKDTVSVDTRVKHEFSFYGTGGMYNLIYKVQGTSSSSDLGGGAGVGYTYNLDEKIGITTGLEFALYGGEVERGSLEGYYTAAFSNSENFRFNYAISGYAEQQRTTMITVPVLLQYKTPLSKSSWFVVAGGAKIGLPVSCKTSAQYGTLTTSGEFDYEHVIYDEDMADYGFVTGLKGVENSKRVTLKLAGILTLESGLRFSLSQSAFLYTGLFLDYGMNSIQKTRAKNVTEYQASNPSKFKHNSALESTNVEKLNFISLGLKIRLSFAR